MPVHFTDGRIGLTYISKEYDGAYSLMHYRVGGEKTGVRRWQDKSGHYTPEGYQHYAEMYGWGKGRKKGSEEALAEKEPAVKKEKKVRGPSPEDSKKRMQGGWGDLDENPEYSMKILSKVHIPVEKLNEIKKISKNDNIAKIRKDINHRGEEGDREIGDTILSDTGRHYNCPNCACAFEMVERGYDVVARRAVDGSNVGDIAKNFKGGELKQAAYSDWQDDARRLERPKGRWALKKWNKWMNEYSEALGNARDKAVEQLRTELENQGVGARGIIVVGWLLDYTVEATTSFHALNYKIESDGHLTLYDAQSWLRCNGEPDLSSLYGCDPRELHYMRTDNLELDENITNMVYSRGRGDK